MDELDRLYRHLVDTLRSEAPHLLRQRFTVGDIGQQLIPYRLHRRALGLDTIQQYEQLVLRLVAGERGYLSTEAVVQDASRQALATPQSDTDVLRRFADAPAALAPDPLRLVLAELEGSGAPLRAPTGSTGSVTGSITGSQPVAAAEPAPTVPPPTSERAPMRDDGASFGHEPPTGRPFAEVAPAASVPSAGSRELTRDTGRPADPRGQPPAAPASPMPHSTRPATPVVGGRCRYCAQPFPEGRAITFCPYCGQNATVVQCPACSSEVEVGWRFCVTCGRAMDADAPVGTTG